MNGTLDRGKRYRLTKRQIPHFQDPTLFHRIARTVCAAECLPRKELFEAWETARRIRRKMRGGRIVDLACGHGLAAWILLILDRTSAAAVCVDRRLPESGKKLFTALSAEWPEVGERIRFVEGDIREVPVFSTDLVVSVHACGTLTDLVMERAMAARARLAVLPCCHHLHRSDTAGLDAWMEGGLAVDAVRVLRLREEGYAVKCQSIPADVTPKNRLILGTPL